MKKKEICLWSLFGTVVVGSFLAFLYLFLSRLFDFNIDFSFNINWGMIGKGALYCGMAVAAIVWLYLFCRLLKAQTSPKENKFKSVLRGIATLIAMVICGFFLLFLLAATVFGIRYTYDVPGLHIHSILTATVIEILFMKLLLKWLKYKEQNAENQGLDRIISFLFWGAVILIVPALVLVSSNHSHSPSCVAITGLTGILISVLPLFQSGKRKWRHLFLVWLILITTFVVHKIIKYVRVQDNPSINDISGASFYGDTLSFWDIKDSYFKDKIT